MTTDKTFGSNNQGQILGIGGGKGGGLKQSKYISNTWRTAAFCMPGRAGTRKLASWLLWNLSTQAWVSASDRGCCSAANAPPHGQHVCTSVGACIMTHVKIGGTSVEFDCCLHLPHCYQLPEMLTAPRIISGHSCRPSQHLQMLTIAAELSGL